MKHYFIAIAVIVTIISGIILAQKKELSIESRWEKVNELAAKQLPESALKELETIITQAENEKNSAQLIKALVYKMRFTLERDPEKAPELIQNFESISEKSVNTAEKAMLYSMTADLYAQYYQNDAFTINERTVVTGFVPKDINEWTKNIYFDKITKLLDASVQNTAVLQQTEALQYEALLEKGEDSRTLQPSLFDFLIHRKINILNQISQATDLKISLDNEVYFTNASDFVKLKLDTISDNSIENKTIKSYQQLIDFHLNNNNIKALIYVDLERIQYVRNQSENNELYFKALNMLEEMYSKNETVVEVIAEKANFYLQKAVETQENINAKRVAYEICEKGIQLYPKYKRIDLLKNIQKTITQKSLSLELNEIVKPNSTLKIKLNYANLKKIEIKVYRVNASAFEYYEYLQNKRQENDEFKNKTLIETKHVILKEDVNFLNNDTTINLTSSKYGIYEIQVNEIAVGNKISTAKSYFTVTNLAFMSRINELPVLKLYVLDRQSGNPIQNVIVTSYKSTWNRSKYELNQFSKLNTNKTGLISIRSTEFYNSNSVHFFEKGEDKYFSSRSISQYYSNYNQKDTSVKLQLFTDRSLYRPGQIVYFKGIAYFANKNQKKTDNNSSYEITLYNVNNEKISSESLKTNDFGSFAGEFVLPESGLNGTYRIESKGMSQTIWVEEYKRPTFEVKIEMPKSEIKFGEKIKIIGHVKAYAGYNIGDAKVKYRVKRVSHRYCWWWNEPETEITNGDAISDSDGKFEVSFIAEKPKNAANSWRGSFYTYTISADVTDSKGETQQGEQSISVGDKSLFIIATVPEKVDKNSNPKFEIYTETLNGERVNSMIDYEIYRLEELSDYIENQESKTDGKTLEKISSGKFNTQDNVLKPDLKKLKSAQYKLILKTKDAFGNEVKTENTFTLYDVADKRSPVKSYTWFLTPKTVCQLGEKVQIRFGTSTKNTMVLYEIMYGNQIIESKWLKFNDEIKDFEIPFKEEYGAGVTVMFTFMKDEKFFVKQVQIARKINETKLTPTLSVFRDKLQPGEKATWTVTIPESAKDKKVAELLVGMYDASLDAIRPQSWNFYPIFIEPILFSSAWNVSENNIRSAWSYFNADYKDIYSYSFDKLNWFGLNLRQTYLYHRPMMIRGTKSMIINAPVSAPEATMVAGENGNEIVINGHVAEKKSAITGAISSIKAKTVTDNIVEEEPLFIIVKPIKIRSNFNETAFFYPQLRTDEQGNVKFTFTAPESLTRWNVKMLAHTADLYFGQAENQVVTQKDLMVQMNLPRFVRRSDKLIMTANVINLTDKKQNASVQFELINPATEKTIKIKDLNTKSITLTANQTKAVEWEITEFAPYEIVICKVIASAGNFNDGEQKYLAVLPDKVLVTESLPLIIRNNETRKFKFESLIKNGSKVETQNLAVEFSANPAWYAVQALPTLSAPENENAIDYFTAYYANTLAGYIANSNPKIATTFDKWKKTGGSRDALLSNLQKNSELKNMLLEETPWVMAAKDETEQKRQIALLFDLNMQKNQNQQYLDKLMKLQTPNGGFAWYEGMPESRYITQEIMLNLARLNRITKENTNDQLQTVIYKALNYLDLEILKDFFELKKYNKDYQKQFCIGNIQMFYLHLRSEYPEIPIHVSAQEAVKFYTAQSEKYWTGFTLYGKAMIAVVAHRNGKIQVANNILKSLKENALKTDEFGMYWAKNSSGYFWNERPIAVQAAIIEAYSEVWKSTADVDEMKIWLLKQKQTQRWDSPMATVNAIYALLLQGSNWLNNESTVKIEVGSKTLQPKEIEAGTAYFKVSIPAIEVKPEMGNIVINNSSLSASKSSGIGWGAMYWQYYQDLDKIVGNGGPLKISKKLFVEKITATGKTMLPIEQTKLTKGDKIITRLVISTDRNMEFVSLKDLRASCFEPVNQRSGSYWKEKLCYYQTTKDASTQFFFSFLPKGTYVFEYELWANNSGEFTSGIASVQCQYAPEFISHTGGERIVIR